MLTLAVIGDFGVESKNSIAVSKLVKSWDPNFILTTGDNLYSPPTEQNYSRIVGTLYKEYLSSQEKQRAPLKTSKDLLISANNTKKSINYPTKFLPCIGNHDYPPGAYVNYFRLPTFYAAEFLIPKRNLLKVISLNSNGDHLDGKFSSKGNSPQKSWLEKELEKSTEFRWIIVTFHHPQICSNNSEEENERNLFPFHEYPNVALILCGHQHIYERLEFNGITNLVVGTSGHSIRRKSDSIVEGSMHLDDSGFGALKLEISQEKIQGTYYVIEKQQLKGKKILSEQNNILKDQFIIEKDYNHNIINPEL